MKTYNVLFSLSILIILSGAYGCAPVKVISSELNPGVESMGYKTYNFADLNLKTPTPDQVNTGRFDMLKDAVSRELEAKGLTKTTDPDLWVNIGVLVEEKIQTRETDIRDAPVYMGTRSYHWESQEIPVGSYREGTVTMDFVDAKTDKMVGQTVASSVLVDKDEKLKKRIDEAVAKIFDELWKSGM